MDKIIEQLAPYWLNWQETAIANPIYSLVLGITAFFIGMLLVIILKSPKIARLTRQLTQEQQVLQQTKQKHDALSEQLEQSSTDLVQEKASTETKLAEKQVIIEKISQEKDNEVKTMHSELNSKAQQLEKAQKQLDTHTDQASQLSSTQAKMTEMEQVLNQSTDESVQLKQKIKQLESKLNKNSDAAPVVKNIDHAAFIPTVIEQPKEIIEAEITIPSPAIPVEPILVIDEPIQEVVPEVIPEPAEKPTPVPAPIPDQTPLAKNTGQVFTTRKSLASSDEKLDETSVSFSEKLANMADKMDSIQNKLTGLFGKK